MMYVCMYKLEQSLMMDQGEIRDRQRERTSRPPTPFGQRYQTVSSSSNLSINKQERGINIQIKSDNTDAISPTSPD